MGRGTLDVGRWSGVGTRLTTDCSYCFSLLPGFTWEVAMRCDVNIITACR